MELSDSANASRKAAFEKIVEDERAENTFFIPPLHLPIHRHRPLQSRSLSTPTPPQQHQTVNDDSPAPPPSSSQPPENSLQLSSLPSPASSLPPPPSASTQPGAKPTQEFAPVHSSSSPPLPTSLTWRGDDVATKIGHVDRFLESDVEDNFSNADGLEILQDNFEDVDLECKELTEEQWKIFFTNWSPSGSASPLTGDVGLLPAPAPAPAPSSSPSSKSSPPPPPPPPVTTSLTHRDDEAARSPSTHTPHFDCFLESIVQDFDDHVPDIETDQLAASDELEILEDGGIGILPH